MARGSLALISLEEVSLSDTEVMIAISPISNVGILSGYQEDLPKIHSKDAHTEEEKLSKQDRFSPLWMVYRQYYILIFY